MLISTRQFAITAGIGVWLLIVLVNPTPVSAQGQCFTGLADCFQAAARIESFWYRTWTALDCEVGLIACVRIAVFGL